MVCGSTKAHLSSSGSARFGKLCCKKCPWSLYCSWPNLNSRAPKPAAGCCWMLLDAAGCLKPRRKHHKSEHSQDVGNISDHNFKRVSCLTIGLVVPIFFQLLGKDFAPKPGTSSQLKPISLVELHLHPLQITHISLINQIDPT